MEMCICEMYPGFPCANHTFWPAEPEATLSDILLRFSNKGTKPPGLSQTFDPAHPIFPIEKLYDNWTQGLEVFDNHGAFLTVSKIAKGWLRELTLTQPDKMKDPYDLRAAMGAIVNSKMFGVVDYMYCIELTDKGTPHVHALLLCGVDYVNSSKVKQFWPHRYELKAVRDPQAYIRYIFKEKFNPLVIDYCKSKGINQYVYKKESPDY